MKFTSNDTESYYQPFTLTEFQNSISKSNNSAPGPDEIHYTLLTELLKITIKYLVVIYNNIWISGNIPTIWKQAIILPKKKIPQTQPVIDL